MNIFFDPTRNRSCQIVINIVEKNKVMLGDGERWVWWEGDDSIQAVCEGLSKRVTSKQSPLERDERKP